MANGIINSSQIDEIVNDAYEQFTGKTDVTTIDVYSDLFGDSGTLNPNTREGFFGTLYSTGVKRWYLDSKYRSKKANRAFKNMREYGAISEAISMIAPEITENSAYKTFNNGDVIGTYSIQKPEVKNLFFENIQSYALRWTPKGERLNEAMNSKEDLQDFVAMMMVVIDNKLTEVIENLSDLNRNNYITEKLWLQTQVGLGSSNVTGTHAMNVVKAYIDDTNDVTSMTTDEFFRSPKCLLWFIKNFMFISDLMKTQTELFNYDELNEVSYVRATPEERLTFEFIGKFVDMVEAFALSNVFHDEYVKFEGFEKVPCWQSVKNLDLESLTTINMKNIYNHTINKSFVLGVIRDDWTCIETLKSERLANQYFSVEDVQILEKQYVKQYATTTALNGLVLYAEDVTES